MDKYTAPELKINPQLLIVLFCFAVFKVEFPCTGLISGEVIVNMQLNISIFSASNLTALNFIRRKMCLKGMYT